MENTLYVAVGKNVKESKATLLWALQNSGGKKICIIHVHQPAQMIPFMGTKWPVSKLEEQEVRAYREIQRHQMHKILIEYLLICRQMGVPADTSPTEMDCIEEGIVKLISQHGIKELVMGAAANKYYSKKQMGLKSKKAIFVSQHAPISCGIKFICKGHLIHTRKGILNVADAEIISSSLLEASQNTKDGPSMECTLPSSMRQNNKVVPINPDQDCDSTYGCRIDLSSVNCFEKLSSPWSGLDEQGSSNNYGRLSRRYPPSPGHSTSQSCLKGQSSVGQNNQVVPIKTNQNCDITYGYKVDLSSVNCSEKLFSTCSNLDEQESSDDCGRLSRRHPPSSGHSASQSCLKNQSSVGQNNKVVPINLGQDYDKTYGCIVDLSSVNCSEKLTSPCSRFDEQESSDDCGRLSRRYPPSPGHSTSQLCLKSQSSVRQKNQVIPNNPDQDYDSTYGCRVDLLSINCSEKLSSPCSRLGEQGNFGDCGRLSRRYPPSPSHSASQSSIGQNNQIVPINPDQDYDSTYRCRVDLSSVNCSEKLTSSCSKLDEQGSYDDCGRLSRSYPSSLGHSTSQSCLKSQSSVRQNNQVVPNNPDEDYDNTYGCRVDLSSVNCSEKLSSPCSRLGEQGSSGDCGRLSRRYPPSPSHSASQSFVGQNNQVIPINPDQDCDSTYRCKVDLSSGNCSEKLSSPWNRLDEQEGSEDCGRLSRRYPPSTGHSTSQSYQVVDMDMIPSLRVEGVENGLKLSLFPESKKHFRHSSPLSVLDKKTYDDVLYDQLEKSLEEAENVRREALEVAAKRVKAEKDAIEAIQRAKVLGSLYAKQSKQRKEIQEMLSKGKEKVEKMKRQEDEAMDELHVALDKKSLLENHIAETDEIVKSLEMRITSEVELQQTLKKHRDEVQIENDTALKQAEELRRKQGEILGRAGPHFFSEFPYSEIKEATRNFDPSMKIGKGKSRSIYKGLLRHTQVAIKILHSRSLQAPLGLLHREVDILTKLRHPNLVTLIGSCQEASALIYEYLPNGSLEDRLRCQDNTPPLSWQTRINIAAELCSVLIFLHSSKPIGIVHGDLTPSSILLDANFGSKLADFGICHLLPHDISSKNTNQGTFAYMDPEFLSTGELTLKSDVYSLGIILLQLLTGRLALRMIKEVKQALDADKLNEVLDPLAGDWPLEQAEQVAHLALRCCAPNQKNRPELESEVWTLLEPMMFSCEGSSSTTQIGSAEDHLEPPPYLICPISQEIMRDPQVAADGYTYEAVALRKWLASSHHTSPMTNLKLEHCDLVPNHSLRSAIQQYWLSWHKKFKY